MEPDQLDDERWRVSRLRAGDEVVFAALVRLWSPAMVRLAGGYLPSWQVAEEVVQDTWLVVFTGIDGFEGRSSLRTWVFRILVRRAQQTGIRERRALPFAAVWRADEPEAVDHPGNASCDARGWISPLPRRDLSPVGRLASQEGLAEIGAALAGLPPLQRRVVVARDVEGLSADEVCGLLGITANHQRVLLHRAHGRLRAVIGRPGGQASD